MNKPKSSRPNIMIMGPPGSNKSTLADRLLDDSIRQYGHESALSVIDMQHVRRDMRRAEPRTTDAEIWREMRRMAHVAGTNKQPILFNAYNLERWHRLQARQTFKPLVPDLWELYQVDVTTDEILDYWAKRGSKSDPHFITTVERMIRQVEQPLEREGFVAVHKVDMYGRPR